MNRQAQAVVLLLVGGAVLRTSLTDLYLRYVKAGLQPFLIAAGVVLVAAAVATLWYELGPRGAGAVEDPSAEAVEKPRNDDEAVEGPRNDDEAVVPAVAHGHGHGHREPRVAWLLVLPVFALLLVAPPPLGSYAAGRAGTSLQEVSDFPPLPAGDPARISVLDYATRAVFDDGRSLAGRRVRISGFVVIERGEPYLTRMVVSCCAADARPVKVGMSGDVPQGLPADSWLEVTGRYIEKSTRDDVNGGIIPYIDVSEVKPIQAPSQQYES